MTLDVALSLRERAHRSASGRAVAVIDIIRASTTITIALHRGCAAIVPVRTLSEARTLGQTLGDGTLLAGERGATRVTGFALGNSPSEYGRERIEGKTIVLTTTNGTRAFRALEDSPALIACAFLNVSAGARWLMRTGFNVLVVCAGRRGHFSLEDAVGGGMLVDRLLTVSDRSVELSDAARAARQLYIAHRDDLLGMLRGCEWGRSIIQLGFGADLEICAQVDMTDLVPVMRQGRLVAERA